MASKTPSAAGPATRQRLARVLLRTALIPFVTLQGSCAADPPNAPPADAVPRPPLDPPDPPPPPAPAWDRVLEEVSISGDVVVPSGERWLIGPNVRIEGNLRTDSGTIALRPGSTLTFIGADPSRFVGRGPRFETRFQNDFGIWIGDSGSLDVQCTPKTGWNRTGRDSTWLPTDEYWIAPTNRGEFSPRRWYPGDPIPQANGRVPAAEVINVTRDCVIEGPGHIHISAKLPQRIEYVQLRHMGIIRPGPDGGEAGIGRYALHLHFMGEGARGTIIRGVSSIDSGGRVFVPHGSHGVTMIDNVAVNSMGEAFWWDTGDHTNDITVERLAVSGVSIPREIAGSSARPSGIVLGQGANMVMRNSAVSGVVGGKLGTGFDWVTRQAHLDPAVWTFDEGLVAHNNTGPGVRFWVNDGFPHHPQQYVGYRNGAGGIENGAYSNAVRYTDVTLVDDYVVHHTSARPNAITGGSGYERLTIIAEEGPAVQTGRMRLGGSGRLEFVDCELHAAPGHPKVLISPHPETANPFVASFRGCNVTPDDVKWPEPLPAGLEGSSVIFRDLGVEVFVRDGAIQTRPL